MGRQPHLPGIFAGAVIWTLLCLNPAFYESLAVRVMVSSLMTVCYTGLAALELWRSRRSLEVAWVPALVLSLFHAGFYCVRIVVDQGMPFDMALASAGQGTRFFALLVFETDRLDPSSLAKRAVVLHAGPDNFGNVPKGPGADQYTPNSPDATDKTNKTGNAGDRVACGLIVRDD